MRRSSISMLAGLLVGCTSPQRPGWLSPQAMNAAAAPSARELELELGAEGAVTKVAIEHATADAAPAIIRDLALATYPGGTLGEFEEEWVGGVGRVLEVEVRTADGRACEVSAVESGALRYTECRVAAAELPSAVMSALRGAVPDFGEVQEAELRRGPDIEEYRVEVKAAGRTSYVRVTPAGAVLSRGVKLKAELLLPLP